MKAAVLVANQQIELQQQSLLQLAEDECRVQLKATGVCSSDIQRGFDKGAYFYPLIMGHEMAGQVTQVGAKVKDIVPGQRAVIFPLLPCFACEACRQESYAQCGDYGYYGSRRHGGYAEYLDVKPWNLLPIPDAVSFEDAATIEPTAVVLHALRRTDLNADSRANIMIMGAGFLGLLMAQLTRMLLPHCTVTIVDRNPFKLELAKPYVANNVALADEAQWKDYLATASAKSAFDVVFEATGVPSSFVHSVALAKQGGTVIWMGNITADLTIPKAATSQILRKELTIRGSWNSTYRPGKPDDWKDTLDLIAKGLKPSALVTHWISLEEVPGTLRSLYDHKAGAAPFKSIKAMIRYE